jgi:Protein of unknown function (DUF1475)
MIWFLRIYFMGVLAAMLWVTIWASEQVALWNLPAAVGTHPWFIATLFDTYFAFLVFYGWVAYKERSLFVRIVWLLAILLLGNFAIASYLLIQLFRVPADAKLDRVLLRQR